MLVRLCVPWPWTLLVVIMMINASTILMALQLACLLDTNWCYQWLIISGNCHQVISKLTWLSRSAQTTIFCRTATPSPHDMNVAVAYPKVPTSRLGTNDSRHPFAAAIPAAVVGPAESPAAEASTPHPALISCRLNQFPMDLTSFRSLS